MKKILFILFITCFFINANAQVNLVPNPSFEAMDTFCNCGPLWLTPPWISPTGGSPECFKTCAIWQPYVLVPQNTWGYQWPNTGIGYAGFGVWCDPLVYPDAREYIQVRLTDTLKENKKYNVSFYVNLSDSSWYATDNIGVYFSDTAIHKDISDHSPFNSFIPQIENQSGNIITDKINWTLISAIYEANGGEKYITIGNFYNDANTDTLKVPYGGSFPTYGLFSLYYIDDVSVTLIPDTIPPQEPVNMLIVFNAFTPNGDGINDVFHVKGNNIKELHAKIINRWGQELFKWDDVNGGWDGKYKGDFVSSGAYFYIITVTYDDGNVEEKKGSVMVIR
jgi:gliding motility-associated-like protein